MLPWMVVRVHDRADEAVQQWIRPKPWRLSLRLVVAGPAAVLMTSAIVL